MTKPPKNMRGKTGAPGGAPEPKRFRIVADGRPWAEADDEVEAAGHWAAARWKGGTPSRPGPTREVEVYDRGRRLTDAEIRRLTAGIVF